jgi:uncharacterized protein (TIGR00369 family)
MVMSEFICYHPVFLKKLTIDFQKNNFAALSVGNGRKRPIPSLLPCEMNFLKVYTKYTLYLYFSEFKHYAGLFILYQRRFRDMLTINTHQTICREHFGTPIQLEEGVSQVELVTTAAMAVDETGLVHGGYIFGLADYAAMIAVNHPNVVLGAADVKFLKPVRAGETVTASAVVDSRQGKKQVVSVIVSRDGETVFSGNFTCFVLDRHVLS